MYSICLRTLGLDLGFLSYSWRGRGRHFVYYEISSFLFIRPKSRSNILSFMKFTSDVKYGSLKYCRVKAKIIFIKKNRKKPQRKPRIRGKKFEVLIKDKNKWLKFINGGGRGVDKWLVPACRKGVGRCMPYFNVHYSLWHSHQIRKRLLSLHLIILRTKV